MVRRTKMKAVVLSAMLGISAAFAPLAAHAAGLGKISVMSSLGQPLKAEIDLTAVTREEAATIAAKLASPDAFKQANVDFNAALLGLKFAINKRPDGQFFITVTSTQPINDPFVDMLVELNWATGRLVREYTFLLDPSEVTPKPVRLAEAPTPVTPPVAAAQPTQPAVSSPTQARVPEGTSLPKLSEPAPKRGDSKAAPKAAQKSPAAGSTAVATSGTVEVKRGDTLGKIARENLPEGVSLDQMMIALQRSNPGAFINDNINLLKSGVVLNLPDQSGAGSVSGGDARRLVVAQTADFKEYQSKLAGTAAATPATKASAPTQAASGKVTAKVEDKAKPKADTKDQLKLSKGDVAAKGGPASKGVKAAEEDLIAKDRAVKDAQGRVSQLEKNVQDLQKLLEVKNQELAKQQTATGGAALAAKAAADKAGVDKVAAEKAKTDAKVAADKAVADKASADKAKTEADNKAKADKATSDKAASDKAASDKAAAEKSAADKAGADKAKSDSDKTTADAKAAADKAALDAKAAVDKAAAEKATSDKAGVDKAAADKAVGDEKAKADAAKAVISVTPVAPVADAKKDEPKKIEPKNDEPKKVAAPPPEKSLLDEFTDNPLYLAGGGGVLALLAGYAVYAVRRKRKYEKFENSVITGGDLKANSVFGNTGGQSIDTGNSSFQSDFSQIGTSQINADEVDPVAEADVYMAYGRDQQAEEILKEALSKDPNRQTVRMKLLDIYSARGDRKSFEVNASEMYASTGGTGDPWLQVRAQGQAMDPTNPLYGGQAESNSATIPLAAAATAGIALAAGGAAMYGSDASEKTVVLPALGGGGGGLFANDPMTKTIALDAVKANAVQAIDLDFDLDLTRTSDSADIIVLDQLATGETSSSDSGLDFDLGFGSEAAPGPAPMAAAPMLEMPVAAPQVVPPTDFAPGGTLIIDAPLIDDMDATVAYRPRAAPAPPANVAVQDVPSVDFDLGGTSGTLEMPQVKIESIEGFTKTVQLPSSGFEKAPSVMEAPSVDFEFDLGVGGATVVMPAFVATAAVAKPSGMPLGNLDMELSTISLDLNKVNQVAQNTLWQEIATKLDLAKAYEEMGDKDGARELLHEVLKEGDGKQKDAATKMLTTL